MARKICGVYKITNILNGKFYIGSSVDIDRRWYQHKRDLDNNMHGNIYLQHAWNKYGSSNFKFEIVEECEHQFQFEREQFYLNLLNPFGDNGYNIIRQISKEHMSDHYMVKECEICGFEYNTFSPLARYCDSCKKNRHNGAYLAVWAHGGLTEEEVIGWGYDSLEDFWDTNL